MAFEGKAIVGLMEQAIGDGAERYKSLLLKDEEVLAEYKSVRDRLVFTNKRIISIDVKGITGKKVEVFVLPYSKATAYSIETAGTFDLDAEFKIWTSGLGETSFSFVKGTVVLKIAHILGRYVG